MSKENQPKTLKQIGARVCLPVILGLGSLLGLSSCDNTPNRWTDVHTYSGAVARRNIEGIDSQDKSCTIPEDASVNLENYVLEGGAGPDTSVKAEITSTENDCTHTATGTLLKSPIRQARRLVKPER